MHGAGDAAIRIAVVSDAAAIVRLGRAVDRDQVATDASFRVLLAETPPGTERLVAETCAGIVAWAPSGLYASRVGWFWIGVDPAHRRGGLGGRLYARIEQRLRAAGARSIETAPNDDDGRAFLVGRGFRIANVVRKAELAPTNVPPLEPRDDIRTVPLRAALERDRVLFLLYTEAREDVPSARARSAWTYQEWRAETIDSPLLDLDASVVLLERDEPVALAWLYADREGGRAEALMTATRRDRRNRGLARIAKAESARRAAALGITRILTSNDLENGPMLALNRKLGFSETVIVESFVKDLSALAAESPRLGEAEPGGAR